MNNLSHRLCLQCGKNLTGRSDKKFCDAYCRNAYNNQHKAADEQYLQQVNSIIRKNRRILKQLSPEGKTIIRKEVLDQMGYDYRFFTSVFKSGQMTYYMSYDCGFAPMYERSIEKALIIQRQEYMEPLSFAIWRK